MDKLYQEEFIDKYGNKYWIQFFENEGTIKNDNRGDFFEGCIAIDRNGNKKEIKIKISMTLADSRDYWNINDIDKLRAITHELGILDIKITINNKGFDRLPNEFYYNEYDDYTKVTPETLLQDRKKELEESFVKKIGFR